MHKNKCERNRTMSKKNLLPISVLIVISGAMFSSHFGVGDLIFPPILGRGAGTSWFTAALGYLIVNSIGVWLAYMACAHQNQSINRHCIPNSWGNFFGKYLYCHSPFLSLFFFIPPTSVFRNS